MTSSSGRAVAGEAEHRRSGCWKAISFDAAPTGSAEGREEGRPKDQALMAVARLVGQTDCHANQALKRALIFTEVRSSADLSMQSVEFSRAEDQRIGDW